MINFEKIKELILTNDSFLLTTHVNPDADALGSELALVEILKKLNKTFYIVNHSKTPYNLEFLDEKNVITQYDAGVHNEIISQVDIIFFLDLNQLYRTVKMSKALENSNATKVCIDHHTDAENFTEYLFVDPNYSSTGEIIFDLVDKTKLVEFDHNIALQLYAAIMTDTGSFKFERTTPALHRKVAKLLEYDISPIKVYDQIYGQYYFSRIKLLGLALDSIELAGDGKIAHMTITRKNLKDTGAIEADVDGFVNYCLSIKGVKIGLLFFELDDGVKVSFRSKGNIEVNKLAGMFNGGGHVNASGTRLFDVSLAKLKDEILSAANDFVKNI